MPLFVPKDVINSGVKFKGKLKSVQRPRRKRDASFSRDAGSEEAVLISLSLSLSLSGVNDFAVGFIFITQSAERKKRKKTGGRASAVVGRAGVCC